MSNYVLGRYDVDGLKASVLARWAGVISIADISAAVAIVLIYLTKNTGDILPSEKVSTEIASPIVELTGVSYVILMLVFLLIVGGLGWCFYRALTAGELVVETEQLPEG